MNFDRAKDEQLNQEPEVGPLVLASKNNISMDERQEREQLLDPKIFYC